MSINNPPIDPTLDPVTGIPLDASYETQYQVPLGSQPINLEELNAQGKQSNWLYPDNLPPVVARLQARDLTNPGNAQDLSTDGKRNLNVNINSLNPAVNLGGGGGPISPNYSGNFTNQIEFSTNSDYFFDRTCAAKDLLYSVRVSCELDVTNTGSPPDIDYALIWFFLATAAPVPVFNLGMLHLVWNGSTGGSTTCGIFEETYPAGLSIADMGFVAGNDVRLYYQTVRNAPWRLSALWKWKL